MNTPIPTASRLSGVLSPVLTPFNADFSPSVPRFVRHCRWLLEQDVGLAIFGTNSEANSLSRGREAPLLDARGRGPRSGADDAGHGHLCLARHDRADAPTRWKRGCGGVLMLPPFYYKGVSDEGLFRSFADVIDRVADARLRVYLYHIPPVAQVPISLALIERLLRRSRGRSPASRTVRATGATRRALLRRVRRRASTSSPAAKLPARKRARRRRRLHHGHGQRQPGADRELYMHGVARRRRRRAAEGADTRSRRVPEASR